MAGLYDGALKASATLGGMDATDDGVTAGTATATPESHITRHELRITSCITSIRPFRR
jgi:hypothetical protein